MGNGRCASHGGKVPRGDQWHKPQFSSSPGKMFRKLADLERRAAKRAARIAAMTPEELERYKAWKRTHRPGSAEARAAAREHRRQNREARGLLEKLAESRDHPAESAIQLTGVFE